MEHAAVGKLPVSSAAGNGHARPPVEEVAARRDALFETIFRHQPDVVLVIDEADGRVLEANNSIRRVLGREPRSLIGRQFADALSWDGDSSPRNLLEVVRQHSAVVVECEVRRVDGSFCPMHVTASLTSWGGRDVVLVNLSDLSERRKAKAALRSAEHRYRSIYENAIEGIFQTTLDGRYISANPALARIYGYASPAALIEGLTDIAGCLYIDPKRRDEFRRLLEENDSVGGFESQVRRADGSVVWISENARAVRNSKGQLLYYEGTVIEITRRKRAEEEQNQLVEALARANRLKSEFVAGISHELRTPLNIMLGYAELLLTEVFGPLASRQKEPLAQIERSGRDLLLLIDQMLDLNRLDGGRLPIVTGSVHPAILLRELRSELGGLLVKPEIAVDWQIEDDLPTLATDAAKLKVVLKNLIDNAMKFTDAGEVRIAARAVAEGVEFAVIDTGIGIAPEALPIIFDAFRQVDGSMTRRHGGVGLGLHLARRLVELLGGTIEVESAPAEGSRFRVWIPRQPA